MGKYILKRILLLVPILLVVSFLVYGIVELSPADPTYLLINDNSSQEQVAAVRAQYGLDDPFFVRYGRYLFDLVQGNLGTSFLTRVPVINELAARFPYTLELSFLSLLVGIVVAVPLGILSARKQSTWIDSLSTGFAMLGISIPTFWLGLLFILLFSLILGWLPSSGATGPTSIILPTVCLSIQNIASMMRTTRSSMLEVLRQDYLNTARAKGVREKVVVWKHALKNALIPMLTVIGSSFGTTLGGTIITETVFAWPGVSSYIISSAMRADPAPVVSSVVVITALVIIIQLVVDILYAYVDPRIKSIYSR